MFEALLKILPLTASAFQWLLAQDTKERKEFAFLCQKISENLESYADYATKNPNKIPPERKLCAELRLYVPEIQSMAQQLMDKGVLEVSQLMNMANQLNTTCDAWEKHSENIEKDSLSHDISLIEVEEAAGHFKGLANIIRRDFA